MAQRSTSLLLSSFLQQSKQGTGNDVLSVSDPCSSRRHIDPHPCESEIGEGKKKKRNYDSDEISEDGSDSSRSGSEKEERLRVDPETVMILVVFSDSNDASEIVQKTFMEDFSKLDGHGKQMAKRVFLLDKGKLEGLPRSIILDGQKDFLSINHGIRVVVKDPKLIHST